MFFEPFDSMLAIGLFFKTNTFPGTKSVQKKNNNFEHRTKDRISNPYNSF